MTTETLLPLPEMEEPENGVAIAIPAAAAAADDADSKSKNPIVSAVEGIFSLAVGFTAEFMSAVLNHPQVQDAASGVMVAGMNRFMAQKDLGNRILEMDENMTVYYDAMAQKTGADIPEMASNLWKGFTGKGKEKAVQNN